jgi:hypothetical protein
VTLIILPLLVGCQPDIGVSTIRGEMIVSPSLSDVGLVGVGETLDFNLQLDHLDGPAVDIRNATIQWVEGGGFSVTEYPDSLDAFGTAFIALQFNPPYSGFHRSILTIVSDAGESELQVELRGRGGAAEAQVWPLVLDFGMVEDGESSTLELTIASEGEVSLAYEVSLADGTWFDAGTASADVATGIQASQTVTVTSDTSEKLTDTLILTSNDPQNPRLEIPLRANDCEGGSAQLYDEDGDGVTSCAGDCNDDDARIGPGNDEDWDEVDQDCDGVIDEGTWGGDDDGDSFSEADGDCNDADDAVNPNAEEVENGIDDNCDGAIDNGTGSDDSDGDGVAWWAGDCDDDYADAYPGAPELEDYVDNDCDGKVDEGTDYADDDGDGYTELDGDCDDTDSGVKPGAAESEDGVDNDCDSTVDEGTRSYDDDSDGFTERGDDCDDTDATVNPGAPEVLDDRVDNDCDGQVDE